MLPEQNQPIILEEGGLIRDTPENQQLINLIKKTKQLTREQLLKLADFFQMSRTLTTLVDHLNLIAAAKSFPAPEDEDNYWDGFDEPIPDEKAEQAGKLLLTRMKRVYDGKYSSTPFREYAAYEVKCIPSLLPGLGLLIETKHERAPHVIGVCPVLNG